ncbi:MAG: proton-conducting transporter membrane subunit [Desulfurococcaceae archaeon]
MVPIEGSLIKIAHISITLLGSFIVDWNTRLSKLLRIIGYSIPILFVFLYIDQVFQYQLWLVVFSSFISMGISIHCQGYYRVLYGLARYPQLIVDMVLVAINMFLLSTLLIEVFIMWFILDFLIIILILMEKGSENYHVAITYLTLCVLPSDIALLTLWAIESVEHGLSTPLFTSLVELARNPIKAPWFMGLLVFFGFTAKLAQFPLHMWLPIVHTEAPSHGSAILSGLVVSKLGVFVLLLSTLLISIHPLVYIIALIQGIISSFYGFFAASLQRDLKRIMSYSSVGYSGILTLLIGMSGLYGLELTGLILLYAIYHGVVKALAFMNIGLVEQLTNTRDVYKLGYIDFMLPEAGVLCFIIVLNFIGLPPTAGFIAKAGLLLTILSNIGKMGLFTSALILALIGAISVFSVLYSAKLLSSYTSDYTKILKPALPVPREELISEVYLAMLTLLVPFALSTLINLPVILYIISILSIPLLIFSIIHRIRVRELEISYWLSGVEM